MSAGRRPNHTRPADRALLSVIAENCCQLVRLGSVREVSERGNILGVMVNTDC